MRDGEGHRLAQPVVAELAAEHDHPDHRSCAVLPAVTLIQSPPQRVKLGRPPSALPPLLERLGAGHRPRLALEHVEIVIEVENLLPAAVTALMPGDTDTVVPDLEMGRVQAGLHLAAEAAAVPSRRWCAR